MVLVLSEDDVRATLDLAGLVDVVGEALARQARGEVERPERPHYPVGRGLDGDEPAGTGIAMPAYIHGAAHYATKLVGVHEDNPDRGLPTVNAQVVLSDARTGFPAAFIGGTALTNARTGCIGALAVRELAPAAATLAVIGAGAQARWQTRAIDTVASLADVRIYSPSDSRTACSADLSARDIPARAVDTPRAAMEGADAVVTATTATEPVFPADALSPNALVVAVGAYTPEMQELPPDVLEEADAVIADVPAEVADTGDLRDTSLAADDLLAFGDVVATGYARSSPADPVVVDSVGSATLDAAAAATVYRAARRADVGTEVSL